MAPVRVGVLLPGGRPVGDGIHHAVRAPVATLQGDVIAILEGTQGCVTTPPV